MKKIFALVLLLVMVLSISTACNDEAPEPDDGKTPNTDDTEHTDDEQKENAGGENAPAANPVSDFEYRVEGDSVTITAYIGTRTDVVIPLKIDDMPVTKIGNGAFLSDQRVISVRLPNTIACIGNGAFEACASLQSIIFPEGLIKIGSRAFAECTALKNVIIPSTVQEWGFEAFCGAGIENLTLSEGLTTIGETAFGATKIHHLVLPDSMRILESQAF